MTTLLSIDQALARVLAASRPLPTEAVPLEAALDRVLAGDLHASGDVPPFPCSAMDGYAVTAGPGGRRLAVIGESRAGTPFDGIVDPASAVRISTGAAIPAGAEAVIRQEDVTLTDQLVELSTAVPAGDNVRGAGEDMRAGARVLTTGTRLGPGALGAAVAAGAGTLNVARRPRLHVLCTGDELRAPGEPLGPGQIHNSNGPMLCALATRCGAHAAPYRRVADQRDATEAALREALAQADVVIISGGVSVGPHDHVKPALLTLSVEERFWGVALQPGKPTWFGTLDQTLVFGLPGNPVSAAVTFSLFVAPALAVQLGFDPPARLDTSAVLSSTVHRNPGREQALRVRLRRDGAGTVAEPCSRQESHILSSLIDADALAMIPVGEGALSAGDRVELSELLR